MKIWQSKPKATGENNIPTPSAEDILPVVMTQNSIGKVVESLAIEDLVTEKWTIVNKSGKDRGKRVLVEETNASVLSVNGFVALGILDDLLVL